MFNITVPKIYRILTFVLILISSGAIAGSGFEYTWINSQTIRVDRVLNSGRLELPDPQRLPYGSIVVWSEGYSKTLASQSIPWTNEIESCPAEQLNAHLPIELNLSDLGKTDSLILAVAGLQVFPRRGISYRCYWDDGDIPVEPPVECAAQLSNEHLSWSMGPNDRGSNKSSTLNINCSKPTDVTVTTNGSDADAGIVNLGSGVNAKWEWNPGRPVNSNSDENYHVEITPETTNAKSGLYNSSIIFTVNYK